MKTIITKERLTREERECVLTYSEQEQKWVADVSVVRLRNKFVKQGWVETSRTVLPDGTWAASTFEAPYWGVSVRKAERSVREYTDEERQTMSEIAKVRFGKGE